MENPLVTVLLPVYNCEKYIAAAVQSILEQTYTHFELLIIDDCSTDTTLQICKSFDDERIQIIEKEKNTGYVNSLNQGLKIAKGDYIARMDADDISLPTRFEKQVAFLEKNKEIVLCGTAFKIIDTNTIISVPEFNEDIVIGMLQECKIAHPTVMLRFSFIKKHQLSYNTEMMPAEDYDLWVSMLQNGKFHNLQECLLEYRIHEAQISQVKNQIQKERALEIKVKHLQNNYLPLTLQEKEAYKKIITNSVVDFKSIYSFLKLKKGILNHKSNLNKKLLQTFLESLEKKYVSLYFKHNTNYSIAILVNYLKVFPMIANKLTVKETLKLLIKSLLFYKAK